MDSITLTPEENGWLESHNGKVILAPCPDWEPMENFDEHGRYTGLVADIIQIIENKLDFKFKIIRVSAWDKILEKAKRREVDIISAAQVTPEREQYMDWSKPYVTLRNTIIVRNSLKGNLQLKEMQGMRIGVPRGYAVGGYIRINYPELPLLDVPTGWQGLMQVSFGELDAMIMEIPNALFEIEKHRITNLRLAGDVGYELQLAIGVRKDWPIFTTIVGKALDSITKTEREEIFNRWIKLEPYRFYQSRLFWYVVISISAAVSLITGTILIWNRTLKSQVHQRTEEIHFNERRLEALLELSQRTDSSIQEIIEFAFLKMVQLTQSHFGYLAFQDRKGLIYSSLSDDLQDIPKGLDPELKGFWGAAAETGKEVISNNYNYSNPKGRGIPEKFQPIIRYMNIPILSGDQMVAVAGMGNKAGDYDKSDLRQVALLSQGMWRLIRKRRAEELERLLMVQDKMVSLGHVAAGIAHEIRNPLSGINIYLRVLEKHYNNPEKYEKNKKTIKEIRSASGKIEGVIKRVMDFTKPCEPRFAQMDINRPILDALRLADTIYRKSGTEISTELAENLPLCRGETQLIEEVILNLINNSADAMKGQKNPKKIHISTYLEGERLIVSVEDSGPGIPQDTQDKIFEPFFTTKKHSTGIGLSICQRIITDHGGLLTVVPKESGAKFIIKLPITGRWES